MCLPQTHVLNAWFPAGDTVGVASMEEGRVCEADPDPGPVPLLLLYLEVSSLVCMLLLPSYSVSARDQNQLSHTTTYQSVRKHLSSPGYYRGVFTPAVQK